MVIDSDVDAMTGPWGLGDVVLDFEMGLGFDPQGRNGVVVPSTGTSDGSLAVEVTCPIPGCLETTPKNDFVQTTMRITVRHGEQPLGPGVHAVQFEMRFDDDTTENFDLLFFADPGPSAVFSARVAASTGDPELVQTVIADGRFGFHAISAFGSIWVFERTNSSVTRIDAETGELLATIALDAERGGRLTQTTDAVWAAGKPLSRIDPATNQVTHVDIGATSTRITTDGSTIWAAAYDGPLTRLDIDGTSTVVDATDREWFDLAYHDGLVWALLGQDTADNLIAFDGQTGEIRHRQTIPTDGAGFPVRLIATGDELIVGTDTSGGGGRTGAIWILDPATAEITATVELNSRPEGIAVTDSHIWTSGAVIDRASLEVVLDEQYFGFTITIGPDNSIWGTGGISGLGTAHYVALRYAPGDLAS